MNKVILKGNVTSDVQFKITVSDHEIAKFGIAVNEVYGKGDEKKEKTTFVDITAFGKRAATLSKHVKKGDPILIEGKLNLEQWETEGGEKRQKLGVILENFDFLNRRESSDS